MLKTIRTGGILTVDLGAEFVLSGYGFENFCVIMFVYVENFVC